MLEVPKLCNVWQSFILREAASLHHPYRPIEIRHSSNKDSLVHRKFGVRCEDGTDTDTQRHICKLQLAGSSGSCADWSRSEGSWKAKRTRKADYSALHQQPEQYLITQALVSPVLATGSSNLETCQQRHHIPQFDTSVEHYVWRPLDRRRLTHPWPPYLTRLLPNLSLSHIHTDSMGTFSTE